MATQRYRIVSGEESEIHDEPHVEGSRVTVRGIHGRVEERGTPAHEVAEQLGLDIADVYEALAYFHDNPEEMRAVEERRERAAEVARERSCVSPPGGWD
jgi:uncharacterized protein (DUF433 family)